LIVFVRIWWGGVMSYRAALALCALLMLAGCNSLASPEHPSVIKIADASASGRVTYGTYVLRANDRLRIKVYNEPEITGEYQVDASGFVSVPLAGRVRAAGLTAGQLERSLMARLNDGVIRDPKVNVEVATHAFFYIHGEVKQPAEIAYKPGLTVLDAVAAAGGFTYRANEDKAYIRRAGSAVEAAHSTKIPIAVYPGDNIRIPERYF
jgi:polysaccharide biosynthesis/export protein